MNGTDLSHDASRCMKCGFCLSLCPIYNVDHIESHVARGRIMLIHMANNNTIPLDQSYRESLYYCLLCGRCKAVCPAKLSPPHITLQARNKLLEEKGSTGVPRSIYQGILKYRLILTLFIRLQKSFPIKNKPLQYFAEFFSAFSEGTPISELSAQSLSKSIPERVKPPDGIDIKGEVAIFPGCFFEFFYSDIGRDIIYSIAESGFEVVYPKGLRCCGQAVYNMGDLQTAKIMAEGNIEILSKYEHIVTGCASCGSALKTYGQYFSETDPIQKKAETFSEKVSDFSEFLINQKFKPRLKPGSPVKVTYHDPCRLKLHQDVFSQPREILKSLKGIEYVEMDSADACCGGGSFGITDQNVGSIIQSKKLESIKKAGVDAVITSCPDCMITIQHGLEREKISIKVLHISELIQYQDR